MTAKLETNNCLGLSSDLPCFLSEIGDQRTVGRAWCLVCIVLLGERSLLSRGNEEVSGGMERARFAFGVAFEDFEAIGASFSIVGRDLEGREWRKGLQSIAINI